MGTELRDALKPIKDRLRITKVVCTRSVKGKNGDVYVGFSASWDTIQDDAGGAADLISAQDGDVARGNHTSGMTLKESKAAALLVAMNAEIATEIGAQGLLQIFRAMEAAGMAQIRQAMGNIHEATQQNLASSRQAERAAHDLDELGRKLVALVGGRPARAYPDTRARENR